MCTGLDLNQHYRIIDKLYTKVALYIWNTARNNKTNKIALQNNVRSASARTQMLLSKGTLVLTKPRFYRTNTRQTLTLK